MAQACEVLDQQWLMRQYSGHQMRWAVHLQVSIVSKAPQVRRQRRQAHMASAPAVAVSGQGASLQRQAAPLLTAKKAVSWTAASDPVSSGPGSSTNVQTSWHDS